MKNVKLQIKEGGNLMAEVFNSPELFQEIFNHNQLAVALTDEAGNMLVSNPLFIKIYSQATPSIHLSSLIAPASGDENKELPQTKEFRFSAEHRTVKIAYSKLAQKQGGASYLWQASYETEETLKVKMSSLKNLYRSFIDTSFELIFRTSSEGNILFANRLFLNSFEFESYRKVKGSRVEQIFEDAATYKRLEKQLLETKRISSETIFFRRADGTRLTGLVNCHLHQDEFGVAVFNWTVLDVSRQVESESALKLNNEQLAKVNRQMEKFLYSTSHDLRSPITSILGLINLMRLESQDAVMMDYAAKIESSTLKLDKVIRDIMSFSRTTYQRVASERIDFDLLTWKVINNYRTDPSVKKINFEVKTNDAFPFYGDLGRMDIIIENIIRNAVQFYDLNKTRSFIRTNIVTDKAKVLIEFIDNGIGIGQQHMEHIFNMFYKASHLSKGAGLGLYIVKETVEKLQGTIAVESEIGFGTVFRITIPNDHKGKLISRKLELQHNT